MILSNYYWYFKSALTPKFCDDVIKYGLKLIKKQVGIFSGTRLSLANLLNINLINITTGIVILKIKLIIMVK